VIAGLVLAAGAGTRFGADGKLLADLAGRPLLEHAVRTQCAVTVLEPVLVVLGARAEEVQERVAFGRAEPLVFAGWQEGQSASLRYGAERLFAQGAERVIITLGDEPFLTPAVIERFLTEAPGARAVYHGRPGHPVVLGREHAPGLRALSGDRGARSLLWGPEIECSALCSGRDVDTPHDLEEIRDEARAVI
jgi:CTP:molybdopterin cytidylyltransferase MocA